MRCFRSLPCIKKGYACVAMAFLLSTWCCCFCYPTHEEESNPKHLFRVSNAKLLMVYLSCLFFAMFAAIGLPLSLFSLFIFLTLFHGCFFFSLVVRYFLLCCLCILFILIWQVGAFVCLKKLEMMFEFCAIVCHINCMMRYFCYLPVCC